MDWFLASILSLVCIVGYRIFSKYFLASKEISPTAFSIVESIIVLFISMFFILIFGFEFSGGIKELIILIFKAFTSGGAALLMSISLKNIVASEFQIINSSRLFLTLFTGILLFDEELTSVKVIAALLVVVSILLVTIRKNKFKFTKYHLLGLFSALLFGVVYTTDKYITDYFNTFTMLLLGFIFSQIFKFFVTPENIKIVPKALRDKEYIFPALITGFFLSGIYLFQYYAYQKGGDLSTVNIIKGSATVFIVFFSAVFLKDREILWRKILAAFLVSLSLVIIKIL